MAARGMTGTLFALQTSSIVLTVLTCVCISQTDQRVKKSKVAQTRAISTLTPLSSDFPETDPSYRAALNPSPCLRGSEPALSRYRRHAQTDTSPGAACVKPFKARN